LNDCRSISGINEQGDIISEFAGDLAGSRFAAPDAELAEAKAKAGTTVRIINPVTQPFGGSEACECYRYRCEALGRDGAERNDTASVSVGPTEIRGSSFKLGFGFPAAFSANNVKASRMVS
jgi:hypothetical protein